MLQVDKLACELSTAPLAPFFGFKRVFAFYLQVDVLTAVPSICRLSLKIFFYMYVYGRSYGAFLLAKAPRGTKLNHVISSLLFYTVAEGSLAF